MVVKSTYKNPQVPAFVFGTPEVANVVFVDPDGMLHHVSLKISTYRGNAVRAAGVLLNEGAYVPPCWNGRKEWAREIVRCWQQYTGHQATLEATGAPFPTPENAI